MAIRYSVFFQQTNIENIVITTTNIAQFLPYMYLHKSIFIGKKEAILGYLTKYR